MRSPKILRAAPLAVLAVIVAVAAPTRAQDFVNAQWLPLTRGGLPIGDPVGDSTGGNSDPRDIVGDENNPAAYVFQDASYLYFRLRVNADPIQNEAFIPFGWACAVEADTTVNTYEFLAAVNGIEANGPGGENDQVEWRWNETTLPGDVDKVTEQADVLVSAHQRSVYSRAVVAPTTFANNPDYFIDWAIPLSSIRAGGNGAPGIAAGTKLRFACGSSSNAQSYGSDPACGLPNDQCTLSNTFSDPVLCGATSCTDDSDNDGVRDAVESSAGIGTKIDDKDTDGDGIQDNVELSATGGAGPYSGIDTDGDGTIDAKDLDSDNDCVPDQVEGVAGYRNPASPSTNRSANCSGATPVCKSTNGTCVACNGKFGSGTSAACSTAAAPICNTGGALSGQCTQCGAAEIAACVGATPVCNLTTGSCAACNGDFGSNAAAKCPTAGAPACNTNGKCTECSATNATRCTGTTPVCNTTSGSCAACNGDFGSGAAQACRDAAAPYCNLAGPSQGTCGKCADDGSCGTGHTGPTCDQPTGACTDVDTDGDGVNDSVETGLGTDKTKKDSDGDGIDDKTELTPIGGTTTAAVDTDGDGTIDALDLDSDGDSVPDKDEGTADVDSDGKPNYRDTDDDDDTILTKDEVADATGSGSSDDVDGDRAKNYYDTDADGDGLLDGAEGRPDTNGNGKPEYLDVIAPPNGGTSSGSDGGGGGPVVDSGATSSSSSSSSSGAVDPSGDESGVLEGGGFGCSASRSSSSSRTTGFGFLAVVIGALCLRRRRSST